jgi:hypothetical protein
MARRRAGTLALLMGWALLQVAVAPQPAASRDKSHGSQQRHPEHWKRDPNRWHSSRWNRHEHYNHWNRPVDHRRHHPGWARHDWQRHRPWKHGWYGRGWYGDVPPWGWWQPQSAAWGIAGLATAATISSAVTAAIDAKQNTIVVPGSTDRLDYGSVEAPNDHVATFVVDRGGRSYAMDADCADGELNGHAPNDAAEAQLLNAACQVAFGS